MKKRILYLIPFLLILISLLACQSGKASNFEPEDTLVVATLPAASATLQPSSTPLSPSTATSFPSPTAIPPINLWIDPSLPQPFQKVSFPAGFAQVLDPDQADLRLEISNSNPISRWIFTLVAPFPTIPGEISSSELRQAWQGTVTPTFQGAPLLLSADTLKILTALWGTPAQNAVKVLSPDEIVSFAWDNRPTWAIVPFEDLEPRWKVLEIDGLSPLHKNFLPDNYTLSVPISLLVKDSTESPVEKLSNLFPASNRDSSKLTTLMLTGVTAMVRGTALTMEQRGITYPAQDIGSWLREADILHISNEIPFFDQCPYPELYPAELRFCSSPGYIGLLEEIGTDIVELSGDHFGDYGSQAMEQTLKMYKDRSWPYYGGGANLAEGRQPLLIEHNGNHLAFLGCNAKGISFYAPAADNKPGAAACDFEYLQQEVARLKDQGYLVIVTFQDEEYYRYEAQPKLVTNFHLAAEAGADIVSGSQAHQPHAMEFLKNTFIHYGLGNLFFDQYRFFPGSELDHAFIDRHVFYDGRYISTELLPIHFIDLARSRPMTNSEKVDFLKTIFQASGWEK
jgi:poly-gamma-glutamate synthesis protein (capsule biosynthesis protein)